MTKPMPSGCIKEHPVPSWLKFNLLLKTVNLVDKIGHPLLSILSLTRKNQLNESTHIKIFASGY